MGPKLKIEIVGDIMPCDSPLMSGQGVYSSCKGDFSVIFADLVRSRPTVDFRIGNFEAVLVGSREMASPGSAAMKTPLSVIPALKACGFQYVSIANNHTMEYGRESFLWMCGRLDESGLETFGHQRAPCRVVRHHGGGLKVGMFAFSTVPAMYGLDPEYYFVDAGKRPEVDALLRRLCEAKAECDRLLVFPHWGNEFMGRPAPWQVRLAGEMISSGADGIFGAHPHVIQPVHMIDGVPVYFSMGNVLTDYVQERFRRNAVVSLAIGRESVTHSARIYSCDRRFRIHDTGESMARNEAASPVEDDDVYAAEANRIRVQVRRESVAHLVKHPLRWIFNGTLWRWLLARAWFLLRNAENIRKSPNAVYAGPIH